MVNITHKSNTLRQAVATAILKVSASEAIKAIQNKQVPKGDVFEFSRAAGLLAIKKTSDVIPDCHPLPVEYASITYEVKDLQVEISVEVHSIYKTGVEVEAMHGAAITALTMYDMLKPIDKAVEISTIKLQSKTGGKTDLNKESASNLTCAVVVCSDTIHAGKAEDITGKAVIEKLQQYKLNTTFYEVVPDDTEAIQTKAKQLAKQHVSIVLFTGGTGVSPRDVTPEALKPLLDYEIPGIVETARNYGQQRTPYAMLSRGVAGFIDQTLIISLPGSVKGATETLQAVFPQVLHVFRVREGLRHE